MGYMYRCDAITTIPKAQLLLRRATPTVRGVLMCIRGNNDG